MLGKKTVATEAEGEVGSERGWRRDLRAHNWKSNTQRPGLMSTQRRRIQECPPAFEMPRLECEHLVSAEASQQEQTAAWDSVTAVGPTWGSPRKESRPCATCLGEWGLDLALLPVRSCGWQTKEPSEISLQSWHGGPRDKSGLAESGGDKASKPQLIPTGWPQCFQGPQEEMVCVSACKHHTHTPLLEKEVGRLLIMWALENNLSLQLSTPRSPFTYLVSKFEFACVLSRFSRVRLFVALWTVAR